MLKFLIFISFFYFLGFYFPVAHSALSEPELTHKTQLIKKNLDQAFWQKTKDQMPMSYISNWNNLKNKNKFFYDFLRSFSKEPSIALNHFQNLFIEKLKNSNTSEENKDYIIEQKLKELKEALSKKNPEEIQKFIARQSFKKADKIMVILYLIHHGALEEKIFNLMEGLKISINDALFFNEIRIKINPYLIEEENFKSESNKALIISHHLLGTGKLNIIENTIKKEINFNLKLPTGDNILHSFFFFTNSTISHETQLKALKIFLQIPQTIPLLMSENLFNVSPIYMAFYNENTKIHELLTKKIAKKNINSILLKKNMTFWQYIEEQKTLKPKPQTKASIAFLNFEAFFQNLLNFFNPYQTIEKQEIFKKYFKRLHEDLMQVEKIRLSLLYEAILSTNKENKSFAILKAILSKNESFFKNLESKDQFAEELFFNLTYSGDKFYLLSNPLSEAIRQSFTPAVESILNQLLKFKPAQEVFEQNKEMGSYSLDPLSLAFLTYSSLDTKDPLKKSAKKIIKLLYEHLPDFKPYKFPVNFTPMEWAFFLGLKEEVQFLHESKKIELPKNNIFKNNILYWIFSWDSYLKEQSFEHLVEYLSSQEIKSKLSVLKKIGSIVEKVSHESAQISSKTSTSSSEDQKLMITLGPKLFKKYKDKTLTLEDLDKMLGGKDKKCEETFH